MPGEEGKITRQNKEIDPWHLEESYSWKCISIVKHIECDFLQKPVQEPVAATFSAFRLVDVRTYDLSITHLNILVAARE